MTVGELKKALDAFPRDAEVLVPDISRGECVPLGELEPQGRENEPVESIVLWPIKE